MKHSSSCDVLNEKVAFTSFFHFVHTSSNHQHSWENFHLLHGCFSLYQGPLLNCLELLFDRSIEAKACLIEWSCSMKMNVQLHIKLHMLLAVVRPPEHLYALKNQSYTYQLKVDESPLTPLQWSAENRPLFSSAASWLLLTHGCFWLPIFFSWFLTLSWSQGCPSLDG